MSERSIFPADEPNNRKRLLADKTKHIRGSRYKRFVFMDRDGVINVERGDYTVSAGQWLWAQGALEGLRMLTEAGFGIIVVTNQACIAKGIQTEEGLAALHEYMLRVVREHGGDILRIYHCPHVTADDCSCRKPKPGMLLQAAEDFGIPLA
jgi:D-glycero-D-manno-heptose 1,7-bisphosphate phosphatase